MYHASQWLQLNSLLRPQSTPRGCLVNPDYDELCPSAILSITQTAKALALPGLAAPAIHALAAESHWVNADYLTDDQVGNPCSYSNYFS